MGVLVDKKEKRGGTCMLELLRGAEKRENELIDNKTTN
jgi:hypothetical protein